MYVQHVTSSTASGAGGLQPGAGGSARRRRLGQVARGQIGPQRMRNLLQTPTPTASSSNFTAAAILQQFLATGQVPTVTTVEEATAVATAIVNSVILGSAVIPAATLPNGQTILTGGARRRLLAPTGLRIDYACAHVARPRAPTSTCCRLQCVQPCVANA
jgi:hypothetical protein